MTITLHITGDLALVVDDAAARSLADQLHDAGFITDHPHNRVSDEEFSDDHPIWSSHSGGSGHYADPEWRPTDGDLAEAFYARVAGKAKVFLDLLIDHPGRRLSTDRILELAPDVFDNDYAIAGSIKGLAKATDASGRRYPFYWWKSRPTAYAMKPAVASTFASARDRVGR